MSLAPCPCGNPMNDYREYVISKMPNNQNETIRLNCYLCGHTAIAPKYHGEPLRFAVYRVDGVWNAAPRAKGEE